MLRGNKQNKKQLQYVYYLSIFLSQGNEKVGKSWLDKDPV